MFIRKILSYGNAWNEFTDLHPREHIDLRAVVARLTPENIRSAQPIREPLRQTGSGITPFHLEGCWVNELQSLGWEELRDSIKTSGTRTINMRGLGHAKNRVSVSLQRHRELFNRWMYTLAPLAARNGHIDIPIAVSLVRDTDEALFGRPAMIRAMLERTQEELIALSPLSHGNPFLLIGISLDDGGIDVVEIESETDVDSRQIVINRSIEFPPEYHQAGIGILSYFGTVLREKYPDHNAKVTIEQDGLIVRLVVESKNGDREVIEKALQEYELVVRGETRAEAFFEASARVLELKSELRIAQVRIESQRDLISFQGQEIATLRHLIGHSLSRPADQHIRIEVNPAISVNSSANSQLQNSVPVISEYIQELSALAANDPAVQLRLLDLEESVNALAFKQGADNVKVSSGLTKLKMFIDEAAETGSVLNKFLTTLSDGISVVQKLAKRYNDIASWCGAPQVPAVFLGRHR
jgi:hypothetical protein